MSDFNILVPFNIQDIWEIKCTIASVFWSGYTDWQERIYLDVNVVGTIRFLKFKSCGVSLVLRDDGKIIITYDNNRQKYSFQHDNIQLTTEKIQAQLLFYNETIKPK